MIGCVVCVLLLVLCFGGCVGVGVGGGVVVVGGGDVC